jgi:hypothetical protein
MVHIPGSQVMTPQQHTARIQSLENAMSLVLFLHIRDDDPAADPETEVKTGDLWAPLT